MNFRHKGVCYGVPPPAALTVTDLGVLPYREAYAAQLAAWERVAAAREQRDERGGGNAIGAAHGDSPPGLAPVGAGEVLLVEHPPVITISARPSAAGHLVASPAQLKAAGVSVEATDRGGDITYHGPGQLVVYPILDLNLLNLRLHDYMRRLEDAVIATLARWNVAGRREAGATGVWVDVRAGDVHGGTSSESGLADSAPAAAKVCAMGIRVKQWISLHGLALNVHPNLEHFNLIVPCGLVGRPVTSLARLLGSGAPTMDEVKHVLVAELRRALPG